MSCMLGRKLGNRVLAWFGLQQERREVFHRAHPENPVWHIQFIALMSSCLVYMCAPGHSSFTRLSTSIAYHLRVEIKTVYTCLCSFLSPD